MNANPKLMYFYLVREFNKTYNLRNPWGSVNLWLIAVTEELRRRGLTVPADWQAPVYPDIPTTHIPHYDFSAAVAKAEDATLLRYGELLSCIVERLATAGWK